jgi:hypothetical protein
VLRILKNYEFFPGPQMELFKSAKRRRGSSAKQVAPPS